MTGNGGGDGGGEGEVCRIKESTADQAAIRWGATAHILEFNSDQHQIRRTSEEGFTYLILAEHPKKV